MCEQIPKENRLTVVLKGLDFTIPEGNNGFNPADNVCELVESGHTMKTLEI